MNLKNIDFSDVRGNHTAVMACVRAVAHGRDLVLLGPPGTGKTMIARRVPLIMDPLTDHERTWIEAEFDGIGYDSWRVSRGGCFRRTPIVDRPFRAPHYTISAAALAGGPVPRYALCPICVKAKREHMHAHHTLPGVPVRRPGEAHLARFGVLMLDELPEFSRMAIGALADTLRHMHGRPMIVATASLCPCGWFGSAVRQCACSDAQISAHKARLEANITALGLADAECATVEPVSLDAMRAAKPCPSAADLRSEIEAIRNPH